MKGVSDAAEINTIFQKLAWQHRKKLVEVLLVEHKKSQKFLKHLYAGEVTTDVRTIIEAQSLSRIIEFTDVASRTIILLDGTCSMDKVLAMCKQTIKEIVHQLRVILSEEGVTAGFEIQFVLYRNYSSSVKLLLQPSEWYSSADDLFAFIDSVSVSGGMGARS